MNIEELLDKAIHEEEDTEDVLTEQQWQMLIEDYALKNAVDIIKRDNKYFADTRDYTVIIKYKGKFYGITYHKKVHGYLYAYDYSSCYAYEYQSVTKTIKTWEKVKWTN